MSIRSCLCAAVLCSIAGGVGRAAEPKKDDPAMPSKEVVAAYAKLGFKLTWSGSNYNSAWFDYSDKELVADAVPTFIAKRETDVNDDLLKRLPAVEQPFGLILYLSGITDGGLKHLAKHKTLVSLNLMSTKIGDAGLKELEGFKQLTRLDLANTPVTDDGMKSLAALDKLAFLNIDAPKITKAGVAELMGLRNLTNLRIGTDIRAIAVKDFTRLTYLGMTGWTDDDLKAIRDLKQLKSLPLGRSKVTDAGLGELRVTVHPVQSIGPAEPPR